jgi:hypothetical protein
MKRQTLISTLALIMACTLFALIVLRPGPCSLLGCFTGNPAPQTAAETGSCCPGTDKSDSGHHASMQDSSCDCGCEYRSTNDSDAIPVAALNAPVVTIAALTASAAPVAEAPVTMVAGCNRDRSPPAPAVPAYILYASLLN